MVGDLKWTLFPIRPDELEFFLDKASDHGHTPGVCSTCGESIDQEADPLDHYVQWPSQLHLLHGWVERGETWFGHKHCIEADRPATLPLLEMPDMFCDCCGTKLTDTRFGINTSNFCSVTCASKEGSWQKMMT